MNNIASIYCFKKLYLLFFCQIFVSTLGYAVMIADAQIEIPLNTWMQLMPEDVKHKPLNRVLIPGTHDSGTSQLDFSHPISPDIWFKIANIAANILPCVGNIIKDWTITQEWNIAEQLDHGIRYFDFRVNYSQVDQKFYITHTFTAVPLQTVLEEIKNFLLKTEEEVIILSMTPGFYDRADMTPQANDQLMQLISLELGDWLNTDSLSGFDDSMTINALGKSGKRVLFYYPGETESNFDFVRYSGYLNIPWNNTSDVNVQMQGLKNNLADMSRASYYLNGISFVLTPQTKDVVDDVALRIFTLCLYHPQSLLTYARAIQGHLDNFVEENKAEIKDKVSIITTDYPTDDFIQRVINLNLE